MGRHLGLDVLRGLAVLLVLFRHVPGELTGVMATLRRGGWSGVDLFFVLSGFLVSGLLFREHQRHGRVHVGRFLVRRGLKIYPAYYVLLAVTFVWCALVRIPFDWRNVVVQTLYLQNYQDRFVAGAPFLLGHTWTLAVEEHFYLLLALATVWLRPSRTKRPFRGLYRTAWLLIVACPAIRVVTAWHEAPNYATHLIPTHVRIDALSMGVVLAYWYHFHHETFVGLVRRWTVLLLPAGLVLAGLPFLFDIDSTPWAMTWGLTSTAVGFAALLAVSVSRPWPDVAPLRWTARIGVDSYSIYLWHLLVLRVVAPVIVVVATRLARQEPHPAVFVSVFLVGSLVVGFVAARLVEWPVLQLRDRLFPSRAHALQPSESGDSRPDHPGIVANVPGDAPASSSEPTRTARR